jgi:hypothetical protein
VEQGALKVFGPVTALLNALQVLSIFAADTANLQIINPAGLALGNDEDMDEGLTGKVVSVEEGSGVCVLL